MNRNQHSALISQYAAPEVSGDGLVSWENGKKCVIPSVKLVGAAVQDGTPTPDAPIMPVCNNGVFAARGRNLIEIPDLIPGMGTITLPCNFTRPIVVNARNDGVVVTKPIWRISLTYADGSLGYIYDAGAGSTANQFPKAFDATSDNPIVGIACRDDYITSGRYTDIQIEYGADATLYTPYYNGGQAQAPELWAVPGTDIRDEWDPQTGRGVRRVKKIVLTGTENLGYGARAITYSISSAPALDSITLNCVCTHLKQYTWVDLWQIGNASDTQGCAASVDQIRLINKIDGWDVDIARAYFAEQYAAGTPVTIWYALATPEPFTTAPAKLTQPTGFGQIIQTGGDVADCPITAKYLKHC